MKIEIINKSKHKLPEYSTSMSAGMDVRANLDGPIVLEPLERCLVSTGLFIAIPEGYEVQVRPRSGLAIKNGITLLNAPGTIDADFRGEVKLVVINLSNETFQVNDGDRIAQLVFAKYEQIEWDEVSILSETSRGTGGFGHTGKE